MTRRIMKRDFQRIAEYIADEYQSRKQRRAHIEDAWDEIDRQCRMEAVQFNRTKDGSIRKHKEWQRFYELPWQMLTLELTTDDITRLLFPSPGKFFDIRPDVTIEALAEIKDLYREELGLGLDAEFSVTDQFVSNVIEGVINFGHTQYDHKNEWTKLLTDCVKYGTFAGRVRTVTRERFIGDYRNTTRQLQTFPALIHYPIRNVYLDDSLPSVLHADSEVGPAHMFVSNMRAGSLLRLLKQGADGWLKSAASDFAQTKADEDITLVEMEGDFFIPRDDEPIYLPNAICTVALGTSRSLVRYKEAGSLRSWVTGVYFADNSCNAGKPSPYGTSPLMMGRTLQTGGTVAFNRTLHAAVYNAEPAIKYDKDDPGFAAQGPLLYPGATIPSTGELVPLLIGDVSALSATYSVFKVDYAEVTGVSNTRIGQQTKSHQTAFAVDQELTRSVLRTVECVQRLKQGAILAATHLEYAAWREIVRKSSEPVRVYVHEYRQFLPISEAMLPENVHISVLGVGEPIEEMQEQQKRLQAIDLAGKLDSLVAQSGGAPLNWTEIRNDVLRDVFGDIARFVQSPAAAPSIVSSAVGAGSQLPGVAEAGTNAAQPTDADLAALGVGVGTGE